MRSYLVARSRRPASRVKHRFGIGCPAHSSIRLGILRVLAYSCADAMPGASRGYLRRVAIVPPNIPGVTDWQPLARGGFATVWRARQPSLNREVAVKVDDRTLDSESERRRFLGEAGAAGHLSGHPCIVTVYDTGILAGGRPYLVMKYCSGGSLTSWLKPDNRQSVERICFVGVRIAEALVAAHEQGMLHRDVKPANILIDNYGNPGLADFGLTALEPGSTIGLTVAYAPPEVILGGQPSEYGDVYQLAATLYALLSGNPPSNSSGGVMSLEDRIARVREPVKPLPDVDQDLMQLLLDGLSFEPSDRPTAAEFRDRLTALGASKVAVAAARPGARQVTLGFIAATLVALVLVALGGSAVYLYEIDRSVTENINRGLDLPPEVTDGEKRPAKDPQTADTLDYLLIGTDDNSALNEGGRSDSLMLLHVNQARDQAYVISIPRNTWVDIPGRGWQRINAAFEIGGPPLVVRTVEKLTGTRIDHVAMIDFQSFVKLTQDLGGVSVTNRKAFSRFPEGSITLSGADALDYVRSGDPGELQRAENQRNVLKAILAKGLSTGVVADPARFTTFLGNAAKRIQVDKSLKDAEIRSTALSIRMKPKDITLLPLPLGDERRVKKQSVYPVNANQLAKLSQALRTDTMAEYVN
jgi:polyisoprenyl-teichoic acid--peptidoglycan teichoic acid transferase